MGGRGSSSSGSGGNQPQLSARQALREASQKRAKVKEENLTEQQFRDRITVEFEKISGATQKQFDFLKDFAKSKGWKVSESDTILGRTRPNGVAKFNEGEIILNRNRTLSQKN